MKWRMTGTPWWIAVSVLLVSCAGSTAASRTTPENEGRAVAEADIQFAADTQARRLEAWVAAFADDGSQHTTKGWITGRDAIREFMRPAFDAPDFKLTWAPERAAIAPGGHLGFTWGRYRSESKDTGGSLVTRTGTYLTAWKRQNDGSWKVLFDTGDPDG